MKEEKVKKLVEVQGLRIIFKYFSTYMFMRSDQWQLRITIIILIILIRIITQTTHTPNPSSSPLSLIFLCKIQKIYRIYVHGDMDDIQVRVRETVRQLES